MKHFALLILFAGLTFAGQPIMHIWSANALITEGSKQFDLGLLNAPVYGIASHLATDRLIGEAGIDYQLDIAGVRTLIAYCNTPDENKTDFLVYSFWGLFPDIWDKCLNRKDFHPSWIEPPIIPLSKGATDLLEEICLLSYTVRF